MAFVVFAGQSNTGGAYMDASTLPAAWTADRLTLIWDDPRGAWVQMQPSVNTGYGALPNAWGPEVQFAIDFRAQHPDEVLRIVKVAEGGTQLAIDPEAFHYDWSPASPGELFDRTTATIARGGNAVGGIRPTAVFYGQGEEDANHQAAAQAYVRNLPDLFTAIRAQWMHDPNGKIGFYEIGGTPPYAADVRNGQAQTDASDPNADSFDARPFPLLADNVHFSAAAQQMSGDAFYRIYQAWAQGAPPPDGAGRVLTSNGPGDALVGGAGADTLNASQGSDILTGGTGGDTFAWAREPWSPARVTDFTPGQDRLDLSALFRTAGYGGADPLADGYVSVLDDGAGGAKILFDHDGPSGAAFPNYIIHLEGTAAAGLTWARLSGAAGGPLTGGPGPDTLTGGDGQDYVRGGEGDDQLNGGGGFDDINGNQGNDTAHGDAGDDWVVGGKDGDLLFGDAGDDLVYGNLGNDTCDGGDGSDIVRGGQGDDSVVGGAGDDFVSGDLGADTLVGGPGADRFHTFGAAGLDRVLDFNAAEGDRVQLDPGTQFTVGQVGSDTVIDMAGGGQMILVGVSMSTLTPGWIFGA